MTSLCDSCARANNDCPIWEPGRQTASCIEYRTMQTAIYTSTPPTEPGAYWWKPSTIREALLVTVFRSDNDGTLWRDRREPAITGLWCQLTCKASAQQKLATEVEKAFKEGYSTDAPFDSLSKIYAISRAARVAKGEE